MRDSPAFTKTVGRVKGVHPAHPYCFWRKDTLHVHTDGGEKTPDKSIDDGRKTIPLDGVQKNTLHVHKWLLVALDLLCDNDKS
jgi:hypothetical protein